jgi:hypothetical protein
VQLRESQARGRELVAEQRAFAAATMPGICGALAILAALLGIFLALHHPLWATWLTPAFVVWCITVWLRPALWLFVLPALLPLAGFSAWTGWVGIEEFDLLALGAVAGCHARMATGRCWRVKRAGTSTEGLAQTSQYQASPSIGPPPGCRAGAVGEPGSLAGDAPRKRSGEGARHALGWPLTVGRFRLAQIGLGLLTVSYLVALARGAADAGGFPLGWFQGYEEPLNSLRIAKSFLLVLLLLPSLASLLASRPLLVGRSLAAGVATGLGWVAVAVLWERAGYPGLLDFSTPYRSTALFWEMHVGGAGLDGFLALTVPFAVHAVVHVRSRWRWGLAALLAMSAAYACLTTFSRGVYLAVGFSLMVLAWLLAAPWRRLRALAMAPRPALVALASEPWRVYGNRVLVAVLLIEILAVLGTGDFMSARFAAGERDLGGRMQHWREGLSLLRDPSEFLLGRGLGRFPANYSQTVPGRQMPGRLRLVEEGEATYLRVLLPRQSVRPGGGFELLQRVPAPFAGTSTVAMDLRSLQPAMLSVGLCHKHLLYAASCTHPAVVRLSGDEGWQHVSLSLTGRKGFPGGWPVPVLGFFDLRLLGPADFIDVDNLSVVDAKGQQLLGNGGFSGGMSQWFFSGRHDFLSWHVDSLFLEVLIDQGLIGLSLLLALLAMAFANLLRGPGADHVLAPYLLAALLACLVVGVFSSLLDMPRSAFLFYLLLCSALVLDARAPESLLEAPSASFKTP